MQILGTNPMNNDSGMGSITLDAPPSPSEAPSDALKDIGAPTPSENASEPHRARKYVSLTAEIKAEATGLKIVH